MFVIIEIRGIACFLFYGALNSTENEAGRRRGREKFNQNAMIGFIAELTRGTPWHLSEERGIDKGIIEDDAGRRRRWEMISKEKENDFSQIEIIIWEIESESGLVKNSSEEAEHNHHHGPHNCDFTAFRCETTFSPELLRVVCINLYWE